MDVNKLIQRVLASKKRHWIVLGIGICGMLLIVFSRNSPAKPAAAIPESPEDSMGMYAQRLEEKLLSVVSQIEGVGEVRVMVTLQNSGESVYVQEEKRNRDTQTEPAATNTAGRISEKEQTELKYVMVENENGRKQALVQTQREPEVQGVIVICEGADDIYVQSRVINVVTTAFRIPSTRVCVEKIKS